MKAAQSASKLKFRKEGHSGVALANKPPVAPNPNLRATPIRKNLLAWYDESKRALPWRDCGDPYRVWLSEMMLQQTQVATVIPYFERFITRWPTVADLAAAPLDDVLHAWAGLGYYARARNLHKAARMVVEEFGGAFPDCVEDLLKLPGVGRYSAGAIASIAFEKKAAIVDGNVARVLARLIVIEEDVRAGAGRDRAWEIAESLVPAKRPGDFNQALMELGATVCLPGTAARCLTCPLRNECGAATAGRAAELPVRTSRAKVKNETHVVIAIEREGKWLMVRRPEGGLWGGLWEMPSSVVAGTRARHGLKRLATDLMLKGFVIENRPFLRFKHQLTHRSIEFVCFAASAQGDRQQWSGDATVRWCSIERMGEVGISRAMMRIVDEIRTLRGSGGRGGVV